MDFHSLVRSVTQRLFPALRRPPVRVYTELVLTCKEPHETAERLRCVCQKAEIEGRRVTLIRIVDPEEVRRRGLDVRGYTDLDGHTEVIWYEGWFRQLPDNKVELIPVNPAQRRSK